MCFLYTSPFYKNCYLLSSWSKNSLAKFIYLMELNEVIQFNSIVAHGAPKMGNKSQKINQFFDTLQKKFKCVSGGFWEYLSNMMQLIARYSLTFYSLFCVKLLSSSMISFSHIPWSKVKYICSARLPYKQNGPIMLLLKKPPRHSSFQDFDYGTF